MGEDEKGGDMSIKDAYDAMVIKKAIHDSRAVLFAEMVGKTGSTQSVLDRLIQEIDELRQKLAERDDQIESLKASVYGLYELEQQLDTAWAQAHRLAHALECLIMDTKDTAVVSKWWDSAFGALEEYNKLKSGAEDEKGGDMSKLSGEIRLSPTDDELRKRFMDPCRLGSEAEWWARRRIEELEQQLADRDEQISDLTISSDTYFAERNSARDVWRRASKDRDELRQQLAESKEEYGRACHLVAQMHAAAVGEVTGPKLGVVDDVAEVRRQLADLTQTSFDLCPECGWRTLIPGDGCLMCAKEELSRTRLKNAIVYGTSHPEIYKTKEDELREQVKLLRDFAVKISQQLPEKPDHWASCSQCEHNSSDAEDVIEATEPKP